MKKTITLLLIVVLVISLFTGCRTGSNAETLATDASRMVDDIMPRSDNAHPTDGDGFIGNGGGARDSTTPSNNGGFMPNM